MKTGPPPSPPTGILRMGAGRPAGPSGAPAAGGAGAAGVGGCTGRTTVGAMVGSGHTSPVRAPAPVRAAADTERVRRAAHRAEAAAGDRPAVRPSANSECGSAAGVPAAAAAADVGKG